MRKVLFQKIKKNEKDLIIKIYQGENINNNDNYFLKKFRINNIGKNEITFKNQC